MLWVDLDWSRFKSEVRLFCSTEPAVPRLKATGIFPFQEAKVGWGGMFLRLKSAGCLNVLMQETMHDDMILPPISSLCSRD